MNDRAGAQVLPLGYGLIGAGGFGHFAANEYRHLPDIELRAVADVRQEAAERTAAALGVEAAPTIDALLAREEIQLVHIASPPHTHFELTMQALDAGKHVLCEKPLAVTLADAELMIERAQERQLLLAVNLIMRYNPLCEAVKQIVDENLLGQPVHAFFENDAQDEHLPPDHWFWDPDKSGGIFIEHAVHFFDLFDWWFGPGEVLSAHHSLRPEANLVEKVQCLVSYHGCLPVHFYHGFTQAARMERQEFRLVFERGAIHLHEWVPTRMDIDCLADQPTLQRLSQLMPEAHVEALDTYHGDQRRVTARQKSFQTDGRYRLVASPPMDKPAMYGHVLRQLLMDQVEAIRNPDHQRRINHDNGYESLLTAVTADQFARQPSPSAARP